MSCPEAVVDVGVESDHIPFVREEIIDVGAHAQFVVMTSPGQSRSDVTCIFIQHNSRLGVASRQACHRDVGVDGPVSEGQYVGLMLLSVLPILRVLPLMSVLPNSILAV